MLSGCAAGGRYSAATYTVRPEDTLYSIAWRHNLDWRELAKSNHIGPDYKLAVGQVLILSPGAMPGAKSAQSAKSSRGSQPLQSSQPSKSPPPSMSSPPSQSPQSSPAPRAAEGSSTSSQSSRQATAPRASERRDARDKTTPQARGALGGTESADAAPTPLIGGHLKWVWPTDRLSPPRPVPGGGILLLGRLGQDIRAAGAGRVVYSGNGLRGYGNLIIIKHGESLLSSYAHNREMLVHEGQEVAAGQVIAHMGTGAHQTSALYFEIRVNGKPTDPLRYLATAK
jgi:lipoprotein NlpD